MVIQSVEREMCETATGCVEHPKGYGKLYAKGGRELTVDEAKRMLADGAAVEVPNAGAQTFRQLFADLGCDDVEVFEWSSSAGDWSFGVLRGSDWYPAFQANRYPYHGFSYSLDPLRAFPSSDALFAYMAGA